MIYAQCQRYTAKLLVLCRSPDPCWILDLFREHGNIYQYPVTALGVKKKAADEQTPTKLSLRFPKSVKSDTHPPHLPVSILSEQQQHLIFGKTLRLINSSE